MYLIYGLADKYQPPKFKGTINLVVALKWLEAITIFTISDHENIVLLTYPKRMLRLGRYSCVLLTQWMTYHGLISSECLIRSKG